MHGCLILLLLSRAGMQAPTSTGAGRYTTDVRACSSQDQSSPADLKVLWSLHPAALSKASRAVAVSLLAGRLFRHLHAPETGQQAVGGPGSAGQATSHAG